MFLSQLTPPQQDAFLQLAAQLVAVDGHFSVEEQVMLSELAISTVDWVPGEVIPIAELIEAFDEPRSQAAALLELIRLAYADGDYGTEERAFIASLAQRMAITGERLARMEAWVVRRLALMAEGLALLEG
jgi:tellurite resistance protein